MMENTHTHSHPYVRRVDTIRTLLIVALIFSTYRLPFSSGKIMSVFTSYFSIICGFAPCALFALYGYYVLRPGRSLKKYILHTLRVFLIVLGVYTVLGCIYQWLYYGNPFSWIRIPTFFTFLIFNKWPINLGDSIWLIQTVLYSLVILAPFRRFSKLWSLDCILCFILLAGGILFGELAFFLDIPFYIERNFLTMTLPYMLLGKILSAASSKIRSFSSEVLSLIFVGGVVLCIMEIYVLSSTGAEAYYGHLIGFIPMTFVTVIRSVRGPRNKEPDFVDQRLRLTYRFMYFIYNPFAEFFFLLSILLIGFPEVFMKVAEFTGLITVVLTFVIARIIAVKMVPNPAKAKNKKHLFFGKSKIPQAEASEEETPVGKDVG